MLLGKELLLLLPLTCFVILNSLNRVLTYLGLQ